MEGFGRYLMPPGSEYRGELWDGMFHGKGILLLPNGGGYRALWNRGDRALLSANFEILINPFKPFTLTASAGCFWYRKVVQKQLVCIQDIK
uniref:MORN repeat-containing protein 5 n=1 Tax=Malurus cyaneus samueli TaxID=2593467 RepID=A0A8C5UE03_9PASS